MSRILFEFLGADEIQPSAIASEEAFGTPTVAIVLVVQPTGILGAEVFGVPTFVTPINSSISCFGIVSAEAFGFLKISRVIRPAQGPSKVPILVAPRRSSRRISGPVARFLPAPGEAIIKELTTRRGRGF